MSPRLRAGSSFVYGHCESDRRGDMSKSIARPAYAPMQVQRAARQRFMINAGRRTLTSPAAGMAGLRVGSCKEQ